MFKRKSCQIHFCFFALLLLKLLKDLVIFWSANFLLTFNNLVNKKKLKIGYYNEQFGAGNFYSF
jgi:hypothetical protein